MTHALEPDPGTQGGPFSIARQPIVDAQKVVVGYELFNRSQLGRAHSLASDVSMVLHSLTQGAACATDKRTDLFVNTTHEGLAGSHWDFLSSRHTVIEVPAVFNHAPEKIEALRPLLQALRGRGFRLAFHFTVVAPQYKAWHELADFVKVDCAAVDAPKRKPLVHAIHNRTGALSIAEKVESAEQFEQLRDSGFLFFQGFWFSQPQLLHTKALNPSQVGALQLFNLLRKDAEIDAIESAIKRDVSLGFNLLRIINAAAFGREQKITSIGQAVALLGREKLKKWAAMLVTSGPDGRATFVGTTAVVRARMMELLAQSLMAPEQQELAFLIGLFSLLDRLLGCPLHEALALVAVDDALADALLRGAGPFKNLLDITIACESEDGEAFSKAAARLELTYRQINIAHMEALVWADQTQV